MRHVTQILESLRYNGSMDSSMERAEAAAFLGVSVSTLDRFASQGRLTRGRAKRKTKPVTIFDRAELERLKGELGTTKPVALPARKSASKVPDAVGFRLDPYYAGRLKAEGEQQGMSAGEYARRLVIRSLEETPTDRFAEHLKTLQTSLTGMFYLILVEKFGASEDEANELVSALSAQGG